MAARIRACAVLLLVLTSAVPARCDRFYAYAPRPVAAADTRVPGEIMVREVTVQKGDTLYGLSRRYAGNGALYPQILLFNDIENPDLIYAGSTVRLPVASRAAGAQEQVQGTPAPAAPPRTAPAAAPQAATPQRLFERALQAYRRNDCPAALELFDRFLAQEPASPLAADAALYQADCYLKQSGQ